MPTRDSTVRLGVDGEEFKRDMKGAGIEGDNALDRIAKGAKPASGALLAVGAAGKSARNQIEGLAARAGPLGQSLGSINGGFLVAAAGIGAFTLAGTQAIARAKEAAAEFATTARAAEELGVGLQTLQEVRGFAFLGRGADAESADEGFATFLERISEARNGSADAAETFERLGVSVVDLNGRLRDGKDVLLDVAGALGRLDSGAERLELRRVLFGDEDGKAFAALDRGRESVEALIDESRRLGLVIDESLIQKGADLQRQTTLTSRAIDNNLNRAFIGLGPLISGSSELMVEFTNSIADAAVAIGDFFAKVEEKSLDGVTTAIRGIDAEIETLQARLAANAIEGDALFPSIGITLDAADRQGIIDQLAELQIQRAAFEKRLEEIRNPGSTAEPASPLPPESLPPSPAEIRATQARADAVRTRTRLIEDATVALDAQLALVQDGLAASEALEESERNRLAILRAGEDARTRAERSGEDGDAAAAAAEATERKRQQKEASESALAEARDAARKRIDEDAKAAAKLTESRRVANEKRLADERRTNEAVLAAQRDFSRQRDDLARQRDLAAPFDGLAARLGEVGSLEALDTLRQQADAERDLVAIRVAGERAAAAASEFQNPDRLRDLAEQTERLAQQERAATKAIADRADVLRKEAELREKVAEAAARVREASAANDRLRSLAAPVIDAAAQVDDVDSLKALDALRQRVEAERDLAAIRVAGERAAAAASEFEDPERLRELAEETERLAQQERAANAVIADRADVLRKEAEFRERAADEAERVREARATNDRLLADQSRATLSSLVDQARGWRNVGDAIESVLQLLLRLKVFDGFGAGLAGGGQGLGGFVGLASQLGRGAASGLGFGPAPLPTGFGIDDLLASARPRAGGGPVSPGQMYRVNEFDREFFQPSVGGNVIPLGGPVGGAQAMPPINFRVISNDPNTRVERDTGIRAGTATRARNVGEFMTEGGRYK